MLYPSLIERKNACVKKVEVWVRCTDIHHDHVKKEHHNDHQSCKVHPFFVLLGFIVIEKVAKSLDEVVF